MAVHWGTYTLPNGQTLTGVHDPVNCVGRGCPIHHPSGHHMRDWPMLWRDDRSLLERTCPHGIGHPDPDHLTYVKTMFGYDAYYTDSLHGCDGCCGTATT